MDWNDCLEDFNYLAKCPKCEKKFKVYQTDQTPGFRDTEHMVCPYCGEIVRSSMEYEYATGKIEE